MTGPALLVVEDDIGVGEALSDVLQDAGAERSAATPAASACLLEPARVDDLRAAVTRVAGPVVS